ncbi:MAG: hypothetical protein GWP08_12125 [Nitrospiraceae bacterium]|nr:hypothetical protein [Nitrospiraceae bacterium]
MTTKTTGKSKTKSRFRAVLKALTRKTKLGKFDLAAGVDEAILTDFGRAHHAKDYPNASTVYKGAGKLEDLRLEFRYDIETPAAFDLAPIPNFKSIYRAWALQVPEIRQNKDRKGFEAFLEQVPPSVKVHVPSVRMVVKPFEGAEVEFRYAFTVTAFVEMTASGDVRITPLGAVLDNPKAFEKALAQAIARSRNAAGKSENTCYELRELIRHIVNVLLAGRISSFVREIDLPSAIDLFGGVQLKNVRVEVLQNFLVLASDIGVSEERAAQLLLDTVLDDEERVVAYAAEAEEAVNRMMPSPKEKAGIVALSALAAGGLPDKGLFLYMSQNFFNTLANRLIRYDGHGGKCKRKGALEYCYSWFLRVWDGAARIAGNGLDVSFKFSGGAGARARLHTHCGATPWVGVSITATTDPTGKFRSDFYVKDNRELWMSAGPHPFKVQWHFGGIPWPLNKIFALIFNLITNIGIGLTAYLGKRWHRRIASFPATFPGTGLTYKAKLNKRLVNVNGRLALLGTIKFGG